jgi:hypothetical protein
MNTCWLHRRTIRNFLEGESPLSSAAQQHIDECETCARELNEQRSLIASLTSKPAATEAPFLRARITNSIREELFQPPQQQPRYAVALALIAICICAATLLLKRAPETKIVLEIEKPRLTLNGAFEFPYDQELNSLRADTTNALRALAANFVPSRDE